MSGDYTAGGRGPGRPGQGGRAGGHGGRGGYGDQERARRQPSDPQSWDEPAWRQDSGRQDSGRQESRRQDQPGGQQNQPGGQRRGASIGQFPPRAAGAQQAGWAGQQAGRGGGGQPGWPSAAPPGAAPQQDRRGSRQGRPGAPWQQTAQGTGSRPAQRGTADPAQAPRGRDPRMAGPRRAADERYAGDSYPPRGDGRFGRDDYESWDEGGSDDAFLPGFRADEAGGRRDRRRRDGGYDGEYGEYGEYEDASRDLRGGGRRGRGGPDGDWDDPGERRPRRGPVRRLAPWIALLVILTPLIAGGYYAYSYYESKYHPADYAGSGSSPTVTVQVKTGDSASSIGPKLVSLGVIASSRALVLAAEHSTNTAGLEPGFYKLNHHMQASLAYAALLNPKDRVQLTVTIPEGKRVSQVVAILAKDTSIPQAQFQQIINNPARLGLPSYANGKVEGYLFPATYQIQPSESALQILQAMVQRYDQEASSIGLAKAGLAPEKVMIEASMVQAEAGHPSDFAKIARVIDNRLADGMKLQFDSVLLYGQNKFAVNITDAETAIPGPYNDFMHTGLPPTPISNPGNEAIQAVLHPANGNWLYFLTYTNRPSVFSPTPLPGMG